MPDRAARILQSRLLRAIRLNRRLAWASFQRTDRRTPYWRTLKAGGELNAKFPGGIEAQKELLEKEGHTVIQKGRTNIRYYVRDYEKALFEL